MHSKSMKKRTDVVNDSEIVDGIQVCISGSNVRYGGVAADVFWDNIFSVESTVVQLRTVVVEIQHIHQYLQSTNTYNPH